MQSKYFNEHEFQYAIKLLEHDPYGAKERFEAYLEKYPGDYYARAYYVMLLTRICLFDEAEIEFETLLNQARYNKFYDCNSTKKLGGFKYNILLCELKLLGAREEYQKILDLLRHNKGILNEKNYRFMDYYCRSKLGLISKKSAFQNADAYRFNQAVNYSEEVFRNHIKRHEADYNLEADSPNETVFSPDFPTEKVINEIKKYIPSDKKLFPGYFEDVYFFKFDNCGRINNKPTNYFSVVCYHNTTNFITMCPTNEYYSSMPVVDLNYLKENEKDNKTTIPSQIEKFNRRFNRK